MVGPIGRGLRRFGGVRDGDRRGRARAGQERDARRGRPRSAARGAPRAAGAMLRTRVHLRLCGGTPTARPGPARGRGDVRASRGTAGRPGLPAGSGGPGRSRRGRSTDRRGGFGQQSPRRVLPPGPVPAGRRRGGRPAVVRRAVRRGPCLPGAPDDAWADTPGGGHLAAQRATRDRRGRRAHGRTHRPRPPPAPTSARARVAPGPPTGPPTAARIGRGLSVSHRGEPLFAHFPFSRTAPASHARPRRVRDHDRRPGPAAWSPGPSAGGSPPCPPTGCGSCR